jgi:hypothetical protein
VATVTTYADCECCGQSGSGSGDVYPVLLCRGTTLPSVLYATFTGVLAGLGTVEIVYAPGSGFWAASDVPGVPCFTGEGLWEFSLGLCVSGDPVAPGVTDETGVFAARSFIGATLGCYFPLPANIKAVDDFDPFLFTESDILEAQNTPTEECPAPCYGETAGVIITETPP